MLSSAVILAVLLLLLLGVPARLSGAQWPLRSPAPALLLWQALGLSGGLLALEVCGLVALAPYGGDVPDALAALERRDPGAVWWSWLAAAVGAGIFLRLLTVLVRSTVRTLRSRRRHRVMVDLLSTRNPLLADTRVVDHAAPVAYCLPGLRSRVVVSRGVLAMLEEPELRAVLAHERAHLAQRHDLVVLPFVALSATFPWLPAVRRARCEVLLLIEVLADDRAARHHDGEVLARALWKVGDAQAPVGGLAVGGRPAEVVVRANRLLHPPPALPRRAQALVLASAAGTAALPLLGLVLPAFLPG